MGSPETLRSVLIGKPSRYELETALNNMRRLWKQDPRGFGQELLAVAEWLSQFTRVVPQVPHTHPNFHTLKERWREIQGGDELTPFDNQFLEFHAENPIVYKELAKLAREGIAKGAQRIGIRMLWEVMRWNLTVVTEDLFSEYKLNNNYHSRYARLMMAEESDLVGVFELRQLKS